MSMSVRSFPGRSSAVLGALSLSLSTFVASRARAQEPPTAVAPAPTAPADASPSSPPPPPPPADVVEPPAPPAAADAEPPPLAGYRNGVFYLRDKEDVFRLYLQGRIHVDALSFWGPGVSSLPPAEALKSTVTLRRLRIDLSGEVFKNWQWVFGAEFGSTAVDNVGANTASSSNTIDPATSQQTFGNRQNGVEAPAVKPIPTDAFINFGPSSYTNFQVGQFYVPFSFENRPSDNYTAFLERSVVIRGIAAPQIRDMGAMFWGESPDKLIYYAVALQNGDGQNRLNADNRYDTIARVVVKPFAPGKGALQDVHFGVSGRYGSRDKSLVGYDINSLTTQGGFAFWRPTYKDSFNRTLHIIPSGDQTAFGFDIHAPVSIVDLTGELVYERSNTREAVDGFQLSPFTERFGALKGYGYYVQGGVWLVGNREIIGLPGYGKPPHIDLTKTQRPAHGLQVLARLEQLHLNYDGASRSGARDSQTPNGDIDLTAATVGINYWTTRHVRVTVNYSLYSFGNSEPVTPSTANGPVQSSHQRAIAPAQLVAKGVDDEARNSGHILHEVQARIGVNF
jgi:hypothetical protein